MIKKYTFWLSTASILQILTALLHSLSFFNNPQPANETESQLLNLMKLYRFDLGAGFTATMNDIVTSMSIGFTLLLFLGGIMNWFLLKKNAGVDILKGVILINLIIFGLCFIAMCCLTFLPPITTTGLIFLALLLAFVTVPRKSA